jgi:hypothetical protein
MSDEWWSAILKWSLVTAPYVFIIAFELWDSKVRWRLIPQEEIDRICSDLLAEYGDEAVEATITREKRAVYDTDMFEANKWRRIRGELIKRANQDFEDSLKLAKLLALLSSGRSTQF